MTTTSIEQVKPPLNQTSGPYLVDQVQERLNSKAVEVVCRIVKDSNDRMERYPANPTLLSFGIFYPNEYYKALNSIVNPPQQIAASSTTEKSNDTFLKNAKQRLDFLLKKGSFYHGQVSSAHFVKGRPLAQSATGITPMDFRIKEQILPSEALGAVQNNLSLIGCGDTCTIAYYEAIKDVLGTEKFDALFASNAKTRFQLNGNDPMNPIQCLMKRTESIAKGSLLYFKNVDYYCAKHPHGEAKGYMTLCCDDTSKEKRFTTLGLRMNGMTHEEIKEKLREEYNATPVGNEIVSEGIAQNPFFFMPLLQAGQLRDKTMTKNQFNDLGGGKTSAFSAQLDAEKITKLANSTIEQGKTLLGSWRT